MIENKLTVQVFNKDGTTNQFLEEKAISNVVFSTMYPGGLYRSCTFFVRSDPTRKTFLTVGDKVLVFSGLEAVWEGSVVSAILDNKKKNPGIKVAAAGLWSTILGKWEINKPWVDNRLASDIWVQGTGLLNVQCDIDRQNRIRFVPKGGVAWGNGIANQAYATYTAPTGQTLKRITFNYDFQEAAQQWALALYNNDAATTDWIVQASGTGSQDITFATPTASCKFYIYSLAAQTPPGDTTIYMEVTNVKVYTETGDVNVFEIAKDLITFCSDLNSTWNYLPQIGTALMPFNTEGFKKLSDVLNEAASFGTTSFEQIAPFLLPSTLSPAYDGKPVVGLEIYPPLTDWDYVVDPSDQNVLLPFSLGLDGDDIYNWIVIEYDDEIGGRKFLSPLDNASLKDDTSIAKYGRRVYKFNTKTSSSANALALGQRFLLDHKEPKYYISSAIKLRDWIRTKDGLEVPASYVRAGKRVRIQNILQSEISESGLTFLISETNYSDSSGELSISCGTPDNLAVILARNNLIRNLQQ